MVEHIKTVEEFKEIIKDGSCMIDFFATWCGPCRMLSPIIEELGEEYKDRIKIYKVDVDEVEQLAKEYGVYSIPTLLFFKDSEKVERLEGYRPKEQIKKILDIIQ